MAKKFSELRAKMSPEAQARAAARAEAMLVEMQLQELRKARKVTQVEVAKAMSVEQAAVSKLERRDDMYVSTLREYVKGLGYMQAPVVVTDDEHWSGFRPDKIEALSQRLTDTAE